MRSIFVGTTSPSAYKRRWLHVLAVSAIVVAAAPSMVTAAEFEFETTDPLQEEPEFLTVDEAYELTAELSDNGAIVARWRMPDGYYLYRHRFEFAGGEGVSLGEAQIPDGKRKVDEFFGDVEVYYHDLEVSIPVLAQSGPLSTAITFQGCADYGLCYPPETKWVSFDVESGGIGTVSNEQPGYTPTGSPTGTATGTSSYTPPDVGLFAILVSAVLAGLILNLMPCVFPVLSIKALSVLDNSAERDRLSHAAGYVVGVVGTFVALGAALGLLREAGEAVGWGFQLQSPGFVASIALLFFVLGLNLMGVLEVPGFGVAMDKPHPVLTGVLAVVVATPCTVPYMAGALGYGLSQGTPMLLVVMTALGLGMALPFVALTTIPALARRLPRPGPWMVTLKQAMAFPMFATVIWLIWVLANQNGANGVLLVLSGCLGLGFLAWIGASKAQRMPWVWVGAIVLATTVVFYLPKAETRLTGFDFAKFEQRTGNGEPVFLNVTATWCITCLANDRSTLASDRVQGFFAEQGIEYMKADWTNRDSQITDLLTRFGRAGVPLYVYFPAHGDPIVLSQILTPNLVIDTITDHTRLARVAVGARS